MDVDLDQLDEAGLLALNRRVVERLRLIRELRAQATMFRFNVGDRVSFVAETGRVVCGTLLRRNRKSVTIRADDGSQWRVSPGFLRHTVDVDVVDAPSVDANLLPRQP